MRVFQLKTGFAVSLAIVALGLITAGTAAAQPKETTPVTVAEFQRLHSKLIKMGQEKVWSIPWQLSVRKARELAAQKKRPVFLWISSNGGTHPLGPC